MKKLIYSVLLLTLIFTASYAQNETYIENRSVKSFNALSACCGIDVYISEGKSSTIRVETNYEEHLPHIITETKNGELKISLTNKNVFKRPQNLWVKVYLSASNLIGAKATSGSDIRSKTPLFADDIKLSASSGADINVELNAGNIECKASSGSDIKVKGKASYASLRASSGSDINLSEMTVGVVDASASSGSDIIVTAMEEINAKASSGGDVVYKGTPKIVNKRERFGGGVRHRK